MKPLCYIVWLFIIITGCKPKTPKNVIQPDKMSRILYDIHIADGYISTLSIPDSAKKVAASYYKGIYKKFDVDSVLYTKSMNYYYAHPDELSDIYGTVTTSLKKTKDSLDKIEAKVLKLEALKKVKKDKDSLAKIKTKGLKPAAVKGAKKDSIIKAKLQKAKALAAKKVQ
jgi:hypothetical protein